MLNSISKLSQNYMLKSNTKILNYKDSLIIISQKGRIIYKLTNEKNKQSFVFKTQSLELKTHEQNNKNSDKLIFKTFEKILSGLQNCYYTKLNLIGIGFRSWVYFNSENQQVLIIKIDLSKDLKFVIPKSVVVFCLTPTLIFIKGVKKDDVKQLALKIKVTKKVDNYKGKGIFFENETKRLKIGKKV